MLSKSQNFRKLLDRIFFTGVQCSQICCLYNTLEFVTKDTVYNLSFINILRKTKIKKMYSFLNLEEI